MALGSTRSGWRPGLVAPDELLIFSRPWGESEHPGLLCCGRGPQEYLIVAVVVQWELVSPRTLPGPRVCLQPLFHVGTVLHGALPSSG